MRSPRDADWPCHHLVLTAPRSSGGPLSVLWRLIPFLVSVLSTACDSGPRTFVDVEAGRVAMVADEIVALRGLLASAGLHPWQLSVEGELASTSGNWVEIDDAGHVWALGLGSAPELDSLAPLGGLRQLTWLRIRHASLDNLEGLGQADHLSLLSIVDSGLRSLAGLDHCRDLRVLDLRGNTLTSMRELAELPALRSLDLADNALTAVDRLVGREYLESLYLQGNILDSAAGLERLPRLERLHLSGNVLVSLQGLRDLPSLRQLLVDNNRLVDVSAVDQLPSLEVVNLNGNQLHVFPQRVVQLPQHMWQDNPGFRQYQIDQAESQSRP